MNAVAPSCGPRFSPLGYWNQVEPAAVQEALREAFVRWGRPEGLRVDNGAPWGSKGDWPTDLALWLIGLGINLIWNPPRRPQDNGVIERSQGTGKRWGEPESCPDYLTLQQRLNEMDRIQREVYPSIGGKSRWQAFEPLGQPTKRPYSHAWEEQNWDLGLVLSHLADYSVPRRVDSKGQVSLYNRNQYVGKQHSGRTIYLTLDPLEREWVFATGAGVELRRTSAEEISPERIMQLRVSHRRVPLRESDRSRERNE
jgi:transposase InsO family protein